MNIPSDPWCGRREVRWEDPGIRSAGFPSYARALGRSALRVPWARPHQRHDERKDRGRRLAARTLALLSVVSGALYLTMLPGGLNPDAPIVAGLILSTEVFCLVLFVVTATVLWSMRHKPREGRPSPDPPSIDVLIPVTDQPRIVAERALTSTACLEWDGPLEVHVLDDRASLELEVRARELGFQYHSRARERIPSTGGRAGLLNFGLARSRGDLVFVLDPDQVVRYEALVPMAGYLALRGVAFVQARESFVVPTGDPFNAQNPIFAEAVQSGYESGDTVASNGSAVLYRRIALQDIGGFPEWNEAEGLATALELHAKGWKSLYFEYPVATGLAPANILEVYRQRLRSAREAMRLFVWRNPLRRPELGWPQRVNHLLAGLTYLGVGIFLPVFFLAPIWSYLTGAPLLIIDGPALVFVRLAYLVLAAAALTIFLQSRAPAKQFRTLAGLFPVYLWATLGALRRPPGARHPHQPPDRAGRRPAPAWPRWVALLPQITILGAHLSLAAYVLLDTQRITWSLATNLLLSAFAVWTLWPVVSYGLRLKARAWDSLASRR